MFSLKIRYVLYGMILSASLITLVAQASTVDGVFGEYFRRMVGMCSASSAQVITGFDNNSGTFGVKVCTTLTNLLDTIGIKVSSGNVGIGTVSIPTEKLEVMGKVKIVDGFQGVGKVLTSDVDGLASWSLPANSGPIGGVALCTARGDTHEDIQRYGACRERDIVICTGAGAGQVWAACNHGATINGNRAGAYGAYFNYTVAVSACNIGYHLPSIAEWNTAIAIFPAKLYNSDEFLPKILRLPMAGNSINFTVSQDRQTGWYWSTTDWVSLGFKQIYLFEEGNSLPQWFDSTNPMVGFSVRCIKD